MDMDQTRLNLQITRPSATDDPDGIRDFELRVNDVPSRLPLLRVKLNPEAFADLLSSALVGSVDGIPARILPRHMRSAHGQERYSVHRVARAPEDYDRRDDIAESWVDQVSRLIGATTATFTNSRGQTNMRWSAFFDNERDGAAWVAREQAVIDAAIIPWEK